MSGSTGAERITSRNAYNHFVSSYEQKLQGLDGFVSANPSGSYNSDMIKSSFGDIDLIIQFNTIKTKKEVKAQLFKYLQDFYPDCLCEFTSVKYKGKKYLSTGEILTIRYFDEDLGYSVQIDNIISLSTDETYFKLYFLNIPAEKQGLICGLVKVALLESKYDIFKLLGITNLPELDKDQELEFSLSTVELQLRKVTYLPDTFKQIDKEIVWSSMKILDVNNLLYHYNLDSDFFTLMRMVESILKNPRSSNRIKGLFTSLVTVKSGERNTQKEIDKQCAIDMIKSL